MLVQDDGKSPQCCLAHRLSLICVLQYNSWFRRSHITDLLDLRGGALYLWSPVLRCLVRQTCKHLSPRPVALAMLSSEVSVLQQAQMVPGGLCKSGTRQSKPITSRKANWPSFNPQSDIIIGHHSSSLAPRLKQCSRTHWHQVVGTNHQDRGLRWSPLVLFRYLIIAECSWRGQELKLWSYFPLLCSSQEWRLAVACAVHVLFEMIYDFKRPPRHKRQ